MIGHRLRIGPKPATMTETWLSPDWPAPPQVRAAVTTRRSPGHSQAPFEHCNLGPHSGEDAAIVQANRSTVQAALQLPATPQWLRQVHGTRVVHYGQQVPSGEPQADAAVTGTPGTVLAILTADCLPVLFCTLDGHAVAAAHAGWRGLAAGVLEATLAAMPAPAAQVLAWLGPCIGAASYEVGAEVREAFMTHDPAADACFAATRPGHWRCDLAALARQRLQAAGVQAIYGGGFDTYGDTRWYSYRRDGKHSGRFASLIWRV
jgi:YfiH family protein